MLGRVERFCSGGIHELRTFFSLEAHSIGFAAAVTLKETEEEEESFPFRKEEAEEERLIGMSCRSGGLKKGGSILVLLTSPLHSQRVSTLSTSPLSPSCCSVLNL